MKLNKKARGAVGTLAVIAGAGAALVAGGAAPDSQSLGTTTTTTTTTTTVPPITEQTIYMRGQGQDLRFEFEGIAGSDSLVRGEPLNIVNETDPMAEGPHTFTLLSQPTINKAPANVRKCFGPKEICGVILKWHGATPQSVKRPVVRVDRPGWDRKGRLRKKGDSWFSVEQGQEFAQDVTSNQQRLRFFCAIHPQMRGSIAIEDGVPTQ